MRKKDQEKARRKALARLNEERLAGRIVERYPHVERLTLELIYHDPDGHASDISRTVVLGPERPALFKFPCPYRECVDGGHDLNDSVLNMIEERNPECHGTTSCMGWQIKSGSEHTVACAS